MGWDWNGTEKCHMDKPGLISLRSLCRRRRRNGSKQTIDLNQRPKEESSFDRKIGSASKSEKRKWGGLRGRWRERNGEESGEGDLGMIIVGRRMER